MTARIKLQLVKLQMKNKGYLLIFENQNKGYVLEEYLSFDEACQTAVFFETEYIGKLNSSMDLNSEAMLATYAHYEQVALYDKSVWLSSDGFNTLYVLPIPIGFNLDFFVKCRMSHQFAFNFIKNSAELVDIYDRRGIQFNAMVN